MRAAKRILETAFRLSILGLISMKCGIPKFNQIVLYVMIVVIMLLQKEIDDADKKDKRK